MESANMMGSAENLNYFAIEEIFPALHTIGAVARHPNGFLAYASTDTSPERMRLYVCNLDDGSMTSLTYTLPDEIDVFGIAKAADGQIFVLERVWGELGESSYNSYVIHLLSEQGLVPFILGMPDSVLIHFAFCPQNKTFYTHTTVQQRDSIQIYSASGELRGRVEHGELIADIVFSTRENNDHILTVFALDESDFSSQKIVYMEDTPLYTPLFSGKTHSFYVDINSVLFGFDFATQSFTPIIDWSANRVSGLIRGILSFDEQYIVFVLDTLADENRILQLTKTDEPLELGTVLRFARFAGWIDLALENSIARFNRENPEYFIQIVDYTVYGEDASLRFNLDLLAGNAPDIFQIAGQGEDIFTAGSAAYSARVLGGFSPLYGARFGFDDFFAPALQALYTDDRCYIAVPRFTLRGISGTNAAIEQIENLTLAELLTFIQEDAGQLFSTEMTQFELMEYIVHTHLDYFVDYHTSETNFDSGTFQRLLETTKHLEPHYEGHWYLVRKASQLQQLAFAPIQSIDYIELGSQVLRGDYRSIGFPGATAYARGTMLVPTSMFGISASSEHKEGAWRFLQQLYLDTTQDGFVAFSINKSAFDAHVEVFQQWVAEREQEKLEGLNVGNVLIYGADETAPDTEMFIPALPSELALEAYPTALELIHKIDRLYLPDEPVLQIIFEEIPAFLHGDRTAEDTARIVQNRVQTFMSEQFRAA